MHIMKRYVVLSVHDLKGHTGEAPTHILDFIFLVKGLHLLKCVSLW